MKADATSQSESDIFEIASELKRLPESVVASNLGITKSSLRRKISPKDPYPPAYDQTFPSGSARRYLERASGKWRVVSLDPKKSRACLETGPMKVRISVDVPAAARFGTSQDS